MNKFQRNINFNSVDDIINFIPNKEANILIKLRSIILDLVPNIQEKISYNVPYFYLNKNLFFIWPGSIPWGKTPKGTVKLGFCLGYLIDDETNIFDSENLKTIRTITFNNIKELLNSIDIIKMKIIESIEKLDE